MKMFHVVGGVAMALSLSEPALASEGPANAKPPCPILRPMAKCALEARPVPELAAAPLAGRIA